MLYSEEPTLFFIELINKFIFCLLEFAFVIIRSGRWVLRSLLNSSESKNQLFLKFPQSEIFDNPRFDLLFGN